MYIRHSSLCEDAHALNRQTYAKRINQIETLVLTIHK